MHALGQAGLGVFIETYLVGYVYEIGHTGLHFANYYCPLKFLRANIKLGLIPFAGVSPKWLFWCHQTIHE